MAYVCPGSRPLYAQQSSHAFLLLETLDGENSWLQPVAETQKATRKDLGYLGKARHSRSRLRQQLCLVTWTIWTLLPFVAYEGPTPSTCKSYQSAPWHFMTFPQNHEQSSAYIYNFDWYLKSGKSQAHSGPRISGLLDALGALANMIIQMLPHITLDFPHMASSKTCKAIDYSWLLPGIWGKISSVGSHLKV
jgi:hypothetical protein